MMRRYLPGSGLLSRTKANFRPSGEKVMFVSISVTSFWGVPPSTGARYRNLKQLTRGKSDALPVCSPDAHTVFYVDAEGKLTSVPLEGGTSKRIAEQPVFSRFDVSPDGKLAAFATYRLGEPKEKLALLAIDSGQILKFLDFERPRAVSSAAIGIGSIRFARDGRAVVYPVRNDGTDNLWLQPLDGSPGKQITDFKSEEITDFRWSFDGKQLAVIRGHTDSDVVLIRDSQQ